MTIGWHFDNTYSKLSNTFKEEIKPKPVQDPKLIILNQEFAEDLNLDFSKANNKDLAKGVDIIAPQIYKKIVGGGQREDDMEILTQTIRHHNLPLEPFDWYLDLRRYGSVPHSGFGLGLERFVAWICGTKHIRETIPFPRTMARLEP